MPGTPRVLPSEGFMPTYAVVRTCLFFAMLRCMQLCSEAPSPSTPPFQDGVRKCTPPPRPAPPRPGGGLSGSSSRRRTPTSPRYFRRGGSGPRSPQSLLPCPGPTTHHLPLRIFFGRDLSRTKLPALESPDPPLGFHVRFVLFLPCSDFW